MAKFSNYVTNQHKIGLRPSTDGIENAIVNIKNGIVPEELVSLTLKESTTYAVFVPHGDRGRASEHFASHNSSDLTTALLEPTVMEGAVADDSRANLYIQGIDGDMHVINGIYKKHHLKTVKSSRVSSSTRDVASLVDDFVLDKVKKEQLSGETLSSHDKAFRDEIEMVKDEEKLSLMDTPVYKVPLELRKYLTKVESASDVYVDLDGIDEATVEMVSSSVQRGILPYQYNEDGDMLLNPQGGVLLEPLLESLKLRNKVDFTGLNETTYLCDYFQLAVIKMLKDPKVHLNGYTASESSVLYNLVKTGLQKNVYGVSALTTDINLHLDREKLEVLLSHSLKDRVALDLSSLLAVIGYILDNDLYDVRKTGLPVLSFSVSRKWVSSMF